MAFKPMERLQQVAEEILVTRVQLIFSLMEDDLNFLIDGC